MISFEGDAARFSKTDGYEWTNLQYPMLPGPDLSGPDWGTGSQKLSKIEGAMFPLFIGNIIIYTVVGKSVKSANGWKETHDCEVKARKRIVVVAGEYDAFKIVCKFLFGFLLVRLGVF